MKKATTQLENIDAKLSKWASEPDMFENRAKRLARKWNREGTELDLASPDSWRAPQEDLPGNRVASIEEQLRREIDCILHMDREAEADLAAKNRVHPVFAG